MLHTRRDEVAPIAFIYALDVRPLELNWLKSIVGVWIRLSAASSSRYSIYVDRHPHRGVAPLLRVACDTNPLGGTVCILSAHIVCFCAIDDFVIVMLFFICHGRAKGRTRLYISDWWLLCVGFGDEMQAFVWTWYHTCGDENDICIREMIEYDSIKWLYMAGGMLRCIFICWSKFSYLNTEANCVIF